MKKLFLILALIFCFFVSGPVSETCSFAETKEIIINTSYSHLYKSSNFDEYYEFTLSNREIASLLGEENGFYKINYVFENENYEGFVPMEFAGPYTPPSETILVYNGKILRETAVFEITTNEKIEGILLQSGHEIYIYEGFDAKKDFTSIKFSLNGKIYTGKVATKDLSPNGINKGVIIGAGAIVALVGVVLIVLGLRKKKKKKWHINLKKGK